MERLQKVLAHAGVASRRKCEEWIQQGRVSVNGRIVTKLGVKVDPNKDIIEVDGRVIRSEQKVYILFHKPKGVITSVHDPKGRRTVIDFFRNKLQERIYPVGRLDYDTEGLLLLTNDGEFANALMHPRHRIPKTYHATLNGIPHGSVLEKLQRGIKLDDGITAPAEVEYFDVFPEQNKSIISITIYEGRNRQVRRMFEAVSFPVQRLQRVGVAFLTLEGVSRGKFRHLSKQEVERLRALASDVTQFSKRKERKGATVRYTRS